MAELVFGNDSTLISKLCGLWRERGSILGLLVNAVRVSFPRF